MRLLGRQIQSIGFSNHGIQIPRRHRREAIIVLALQPFDDVLRQLHAIGRQRHHVGAEARQGIDQGMDRPAVLKIAADHHGQAFEIALFLAQSVKIAQRLGRMLMAAVAGIDHRHIGMLGHRLHRTVPIVAHDQDIGVARHDFGRVGDGLAFGGRGCLHVRAGDHRTAEPLHRRLER